MSLPTQTVIVQDPGTRTVRGAEVADWDPAKVTTRAYDNCTVYDAQTDEDIAARQAVMDAYHVLLPAGAIVHHTSRVVLENGGTYQVKGRPRERTSLSGALDHTAIYVERWEG